MAVHRWGEFGEVAVRMMGQVKAGENLLIVADTWTDMDIAEASLIAGINAKANAQLMVIPRRSLTDVRELGPVLAGALQGADLVVALCDQSIAHKPAMRAAREKGTRIASCMPRGIEDFVIEGILDAHYELQIEVCEKICTLWEKTEVCQVTSSVGTDLSFQMQGRPALVGDGMATEPGEADWFPGVDASMAPVEKSINGKLVIDGSLKPGGLVKTPITCQVEQGVITAIEGGTEATAWRSFLDSTGDPKAFHVCHFTLGLNPRARLSGHGPEDEHVLGAVTFGFGHQDPSYKGRVGTAETHLDVVLASPTISLDGVVICQDNRLNPDLGLGGLDS
ncbi:aminopeptidase [Chloroflexota bacterium]